MYGYFNMKSFAGTRQQDGRASFHSSSILHMLFGKKLFQETGSIYRSLSNTTTHMYSHSFEIIIAIISDRLIHGLESTLRFDIHVVIVFLFLFIGFIPSIHSPIGIVIGILV